MSYTCKILAIDGGGIRGVIPAYILQQLEEAVGSPLYQYFDVIAGTSTGGLIAMGLASVRPDGKPRTATEILNVYMNDESEIFNKQPESYGTTAKYFSIASFLQSLFGSDLTLSQAQQQLQALGHPTPKQVLTTCYTLNTASAAGVGPYLFNWIDAANSSDDDYYVWEATLGTSSAPTYFPVANIGSGAPAGSGATTRWVADGGVAANNPALYALAAAFQLNLCSDLSDVLIVSLGTGLYNVGIQILNGDGNWGLVQWTAGFDVNGNTTEPLINVLAMSNVLSPCQQLQAIMPAGNYYRLEPTIPYNESTLDGTDTQALYDTAQAYIVEGGDGYANYQSVVAALKSS
jgi:patatin-like phospholipase/acyl hydrolase